MKSIRVIVMAWFALAVIVFAHAQAQNPLVGGAAQRKTSAWRSSAPESSMILGAARAGSRLVSVGARGMVLLSDDDGRNWRQAQNVPVRTTLNAVTFVGASTGWAVGHDGAILATSDGGENWTLQRFDTSTDRPLFSVKFLDAKRGVAVGLWSLVLTTSDGGATWNTVQLPPPLNGGKADRNLLRVFADVNGLLFVAAERGTVLRSKDGGATWTYHDTGYQGSLWTGTGIAGGAILVGGLRGSLYRSSDQGETWKAIYSGTKNSLTDMAATGQQVIVVGLDGAISRSSDQGVTFKASQRDDRLPLTAVVATSNATWQMFSKQGVVKTTAEHTLMP
jgi:photosystem II stability/assembly factor-like uncharacterized protein